MIELKEKLEALGVPVYPGYPATGAKPPFIVVRPTVLLPGEESLCGSAQSWGEDLGAYCVAGSVEASSNLAKDAVRLLNGSRISGVVPKLQITYVGHIVEGLYETLVSVTLEKGSL